MKGIFKVVMALAVALVAGAGHQAVAQQVAGVRSGLAVGANKVTIVEQSDVAQTVRAVEQRAFGLNIKEFVFDLHSASRIMLLKILYHARAARASPKGATAQNHG